MQDTYDNIYNYAMKSALLSAIDYWDSLLDQGEIKADDHKQVVGVLTIKVADLVS
jgi:hypothetical protein